MIEYLQKTIDNRIIEIYDNVFSEEEVQFHKDFYYNSVYMSWEDLEIFGRNSYKEDKNLRETKLKTYLMSHDKLSISFFNDDPNEFNFFNVNSFRCVEEKSLKGLSQVMTYFTTYSPVSTSQFHRDGYDDDGLPYEKRFDGGKTLLYYLSDSWDDKCWQGETLFRSDYGMDMVGVGYKPGRIVIFDQDIQHRAIMASSDAEVDRAVFVTFFEK